MNPNKENHIKVILSFLSMIFMIYIGSTLFKKARIDVTQEGLYTISEGTKTILSKIDAPLKLKLFYSKTAAQKGTEGLRRFNNHFNYVKELLEQYVSHSRNNLELTIIDPRPDTPEEEDAILYGLKKFDISATESYFFGLVAESESGSEKVIEFFDPQQKDKLEYELTKLIYMALNPHKKTIGILSSLDVISEEMQPYMAQIMRMQGKPVHESWLVTQMLQDFYQVKKIEKDAESINGIDTLVIIHPKNFSEKTLFAIDQYVLSGGKTLIFTDPNAVSDQNQSTFGGVSSSPDQGFASLMKPWGIEADQNHYAGDKLLSGMGRMNQNQAPGKLLAILNCNQLCSKDYDDVITSEIKNTTFIYPGVLKRNQIDGVATTAILGTTNKGNSYTASPYELNDQASLWTKFEEGKQPIVLGYKSVGLFQTAFPDGPPKEDKKEDENSEKTQNTTKMSPPKNYLKKSTKESAVIVFSDVDFINDQFAFQRSFLGTAVANDNSTIFLNSIEALTGDLSLLSVRSKGKIDRSFELINQIELTAENKTASKVEEINANILKFQNELNTLGQQANQGNIALIQNEGIKKKKELSQKIAGLKKELRAVKREGREKVENIGKTLQYINTLLIPLLVIGIGALYGLHRRKLMLTRINAPINKPQKLSEVSS